MKSDINQKPLLGADNNALVALLSINLVVYVILGFLKVVYYLDSSPIEEFYTNIFHQFTLSNHWSVIVSKPWSVFTYNWVHDGFWALFANMIWLTLFGYVLQNTQANKHLFPIYFYSGVVGALVFSILSTTGTISNPFLGANVSVMAISLATMMIAPQFKVLKNIGNGIPIWIVCVGYTLLQIIALTQYQIASIIAIIVSACMGILYALLLKKEIDLGKWMHNLLNWVNKIGAPK